MVHRVIAAAIHKKARKFSKPAFLLEPNMHLHRYCFCCVFFILNRWSISIQQINENIEIYKSRNYKTHQKVYIYIYITYMHLYVHVYIFYQHRINDQYEDTLTFTEVMMSHPLPTFASSLPGVPAVENLAPSTQSLLIDAYSKVKQHRVEANILQEECTRMLEYYTQLMMTIATAISSLQSSLANPIEFIQSGSNTSSIEMLQQFINTASASSSSTLSISSPQDEPFISGLICSLVNKFISIFNLSELADRLLSPHLAKNFSDSSLHQSSLTTSSTTSSLLEINTIEMDGVGNITGINDEQLINISQHHDQSEPDLMEDTTATAYESNYENIDIQDDITDIPHIDCMMKMDPINISRISSMILHKTVFDLIPRYYLFKVAVPPTASSSAIEPIITSSTANMQNLSSLSHLLPLVDIDKGIKLLQGSHTFKISYHSLGSFDLQTLQAMKTLHQIQNVAAQVNLEINWLNSIANNNTELINDIKSILWRNCLNQCLYTFPSSSFEDAATITVESVTSMICDRQMYIEIVSLIWSIMQNERVSTNFFLPPMLSALLERCSSEAELLSLGKRVFSSTPSTSFQRIKKLFLVIHHSQHYSLVVITPVTKKWYWADSKHIPVPTDGLVPLIINRLINMIYLQYRYINVYSEVWRSTGQPISNLGYLMPHQQTTNFCGFLVCMAAADIGKGKLTNVTQDQFPFIRLQYINHVISYIDSL